MRHLTRIVLSVLAGAAILPAAGTAQETAWRAWTSRPAWVGVGYDVRWLASDGRCEPRVVVEDVVQGSPAERAGLRPGDAIVAVNGRSSASDALQILTGRLTPGDSIRLRIRRGDAERTLTAVADLRPSHPPVVLRERDVRTSSAARAAAAECADRGRWSFVAPRAADVDQIERIRVRADSLRVVIAQRALQAAAHAERQADALRALEHAADEAGRFEVDVRRPSTFVYHFDDFLTGGARGVAGAELTALEPELAGYFPGVREGLLVLRVSDDSPSEEAGLRPGDVVVAVEGRRIESVDDLRRALADRDERVELRVVRKGDLRRITLRR